MTKSANFPGQRNARRQVALAHVERYIAHYSASPPPTQALRGNLIDAKYCKARVRQLQREHAILTERIVPDNVAFNARTKKVRTNRGRQ